jgi:hypothetical protein
LLWVGLIGVDQGELWWLHFRRLDKVTASTESFGGAGIATTPPVADGFLQEVVRVRGSEGVEAVRARVRAEIVAGQRQAALHVGFCPPLEGAPVVEASVASATAPGADASGSGGVEVRVVQAFCHGVRLEVRLTEAAMGDFAVMVLVSAKPRAAANGALPCGEPAGRG